MLGVRCFAGRGVPVASVMQKLDRVKAVQFFESHEVYRKKDVDEDDVPELPVLKSNIRMNSALFLEWIDQVKTRA